MVPSKRILDKLNRELIIIEADIEAAAIADEVIHDKHTFAKLIHLQNERELLIGEISWTDDAVDAEGKTITDKFKTILDLG